MTTTNNKLNIVFFGTSEFAAIILNKILLATNYQLLAVVTQPDKPVGRKKTLTPSPVKILAQQHSLPILQPEKLDITFTATLKLLNADLFIVVAYGKIIPQDIIDLPLYKTINVHPSLLPRYRGPSPIQFALLNGETQTGVSIMLIDKKMDHGPIISNFQFPISNNDTYSTLSKKLAEHSAKLLIETIPDYISGKIKPQPQNHHQATFSKIIIKENGLITADKTAQQIYNMWRAYQPWPEIYLEFRIKNKESRIKLLDIKLSNLVDQKNSSLELFTKDKNLYLQCADNTVLQINQLQLIGKNKMDAKSYINGYLK